jgi:hypothetical protein
MRASRIFALSIVAFALLAPVVAWAEESPDPCAALRSRAEAATVAHRFREASELYLQIYMELMGECVHPGEEDLCEVLDDAASNAEAHYRELGGRLGGAIQLRYRLLAECGEESDYAKAHGGKASERARRALYALGADYQEIGAFSKAATHYEEFARRNAREKEAPGALEEAITYRLALGQDDEAIADAELFEKSYASRRELKARAARVLLSIGVIFERRAEAATIDAKGWSGGGAWRAARQAAEEHYASLLARYGHAASPDVVIRANTRLGRARWEQGETLRGQAAAAFAKALAEADRDAAADEQPELQLEDPAKLRRERYARLIVPEGDEGEAERARRLELMVDAIAAARFHVAERARELAEAEAPPPFAPELAALPRAVKTWFAKAHPAEATALDETLRAAAPEARREVIGRAELQHWIETAFEPWTKRREALQASAEKLYLAAMDEDVPAWKVAASARIGDLHFVLMKAVHDRADEQSCVDGRELACGSVDALELIGTHARDAAIRAYRLCLELSTQSRWSGTWSRLCELQLNALEPRLYPLNDELRAEPTYWLVPRGPRGLVPRIEEPR